MCPVGIALRQSAEMWNTWPHVALQHDGAEHISVFNSNGNPNVDIIKLGDEISRVFSLIHCLSCEDALCRYSNDVWYHHQNQSASHTCHARTTSPVRPEYRVLFEVKANNLLRWFRETMREISPTAQRFAVCCVKLGRRWLTLSSLSLYAQWDAINEMDEYYSPIHTYQVCNYMFYWNELWRA